MHIKSTQKLLGLLIFIFLNLQKKNKSRINQPQSLQDLWRERGRCLSQQVLHSAQQVLRNTASTPLCNRRCSSQPCNYNNPANGVPSKAPLITLEPKEEEEEKKHC